MGYSHTPQEREALEVLIPELAESEDERIRKELIDYLWEQKIYYESDEVKMGDSQKCRLMIDGITWLEKQKEQKPAEYLPKQKVFDIMNKLTNLSYSERIPVDSEEYVKIHEITLAVSKLLDYS